MPDFRSLLSTIGALIAAAASVAGSLYLTLGLGLIACPLCFYQRTFAFAVLGVLVLGAFSRARATGYVNVMALLPTIAGGVVAAFHTYLDMSGKLVCPKGIFDIGTTAQQSLASFVLIALCLLPGLLQDVRKKRVWALTVVMSALIGGAFAYGCIATSPAPTMPPVEKRPLMCHPAVSEN